MPNNETGHEINVSNFKVMIDYCSELGSAYVPSNTAITVANLDTLYTAAKTAMETLSNQAMNVKQPINEREIVFAPLSKLVTRIINYYASTDASKQAVKDAKGMADKIRGFGLKPLTDKDGSVNANHVSNAHLSYVQRAATFRDLVNFLASDPDNYSPNEDELKIPALKGVADSLWNTNEVVESIMKPVYTALSKRNSLMYDPETGALALAQKVKRYCKTISSTNPEVVKKIQALRFRKNSR